jgi:hypothetical protein
MTLEQDNAIKKILTTEVKYVIGIIVFIVGVMAPYYSIKQDIALIKENHFSHMETMTKDILTLQQGKVECDKRYVELLTLIYGITK